MRPNRPLLGRGKAHTDSTPDTEALLTELEREAPAWRKLELMQSLNRWVLELSLAGIRRRNPEATEKELRRLLADIMLGAELATRVYGTSPDSNR